MTTLVGVEIKIIAACILCLTIPTLLLILLSRFRNKPFQSCGESCDCFEQEKCLTE